MTGPPYVLRSLVHSGRRVHAQNDEDGTIEAIFQDIPPRSRYFVEFGIGPAWLDPNYTKGLEGNCIRLKEQGWKGLFMDSALHPARFEVTQEFITALNINSILRKHEVPEEVDVISIDVDGQDFWIWMALDYRPTLIVIEYNSNFQSLTEAMTVPFDPAFRWDGTKYFGASLGALIKLATDKGYKLVHTNGVNAFFVRANMIANQHEFNEDMLLGFVDRHPPDRLARSWTAI